MTTVNMLWAWLRLHSAQVANSTINPKSHFFLTRDTFSCLINHRCSFDSVNSDLKVIPWKVPARHARSAPNGASSDAVRSVLPSFEKTRAIPELCAHGPKLMQPLSYGKIRNNHQLEKGGNKWEFLKMDAWYWPWR